jgi:hypothetical protein
MSVRVRKILIDALKPRETSVVELSEALCAIDGVNGVDVVVTEVDVKTETIKLTVKGSDVKYEEVAKVIEEHGVAIRGVDEVSVSKA